MGASEPAAGNPPVHRLPKPLLRWIAVGLAAFGWLISLQLLQASSGSSASNPVLEALCGSGDEQHPSNCLSVLHSRWAYVPIGSTRLPVAAIGMAYFAMVGLWFLFVGPPTRGRAAWHLPLVVIVVVGAWDSARYVWLMYYELKQVCTGCLVAHAANFGLLLVTFLAWPGRPAGPGLPPHPEARLALATMAAAVLAALLHLALVFTFMIGSNANEVVQRYQALVGDADYVQWAHARQPLVELPPRADEAWLGDPAAPHTLVVFGDFQCTACKQAHGVIADVLREHAGRLRVAYRHFPQDGACNPTFHNRPGHLDACEAAYAAEAVRRIAGPAAYWRMGDLLFEHQQTRRSMAGLAAEAGVSAEEFAGAASAAEARATVSADIELGRSLGIEAVPVLYLDGRRLEHWRNTKAWKRLLEP